MTMAITTQPYFQGFLAIGMFEGECWSFEVGDSIDDLKTRMKKSCHWFSQEELDVMPFLKEVDLDGKDGLLVIPCSERVYYTWLKYKASRWELSVDGAYHPEDCGMPNYYDREDLLPQEAIDLI